MSGTPHWGQVRVNLPTSRSSPCESITDNFTVTSSFSSKEPKSPLRTTRRNSHLLSYQFFTFFLSLRWPLKDVVKDWRLLSESSSLFTPCVCRQTRNLETVNREPRNSCWRLGLPINWSLIAKSLLQASVKILPGRKDLQREHPLSLKAKVRKRGVKLHGLSVPLVNLFFSSPTSDGTWGECQIVLYYAFCVSDATVNMMLRTTSGA